MSSPEHKAAAEILNIKGVVKDFKGLRALDNVDVTIHQNEIFGLIGPNGSGKTTLVNVITGFLPPTAGEITYKGKKITGLKPHEVTRRGIARTFQIANLFPNLTVKENVAAGRYLKTSGSVHGAFFQTRGYRAEEQAVSQKAEEIVTLMEMEKQKNVLAKYLPFGDQRKLEVAIALATDPGLLLLDEPAAGMNPEEQVRLMNLIQLISERIGITIMVIEHNMKVIMGVCTAITVLNYGAKIAEGTPEEIAHDEKVISVYLGGR